MPVLTSQWGHTDEQLRAAGVTKGMLRLSVGLEDAADLIADLDQARDRKRRPMCGPRADTRSAPTRRPAIVSAADVSAPGADARLRP